MEAVGVGGTDCYHTTLATSGVSRVQGNKLRVDLYFQFKLKLIFLKSCNAELAMRTLYVCNRIVPHFDFTANFKYQPASKDAELMEKSVM